MPAGLGANIEIALVSLLVALGVLVGMIVRRRSTTDDASTDDRFRMSFEEAPIGMAVLKTSGELIEVNRALAGILGLERGALVGMNISKIVHVDDQKELGEAWEEMGNGATHSTSQWMRCVTADGRPIWARVSMSLVPRTADQSALVVVQLEDATRSYEERRRLETLLRGKDEFVAAVGDEIRKPLEMLIDLTDFAEHSHTDDRDAMPRIEAHAREIASILDDLVVSARAGMAPITVIPHQFDADNLSRSVLGAVPGAQSVTLDLRSSPVWADSKLTAQILKGLVGNAVRYGGPKVFLRIVRSGPDTVFQVADDGPEIPQDERERIFNGDLRTGQPVTRPATVGLSLTVGRHLARLMDGDIEYRRSSDGENVFELRLPREKITETPRRPEFGEVEVPA